MAATCLMSPGRPTHSAYVDTNATASPGRVVVRNERIDYLSIGAIESGFHVSGTFEVLDGLIIRWEDKFSWTAFTTGLFTGTLRAATSALNGVR